MPIKSIASTQDMKIKIINKATPEEIEAMAKIEAKAFPSGEAWDFGALASHFASDCQKAYVLFWGDEMAALLLTSTIPPESEVFHVATIPAMRQKGCGKKLLEAFFATEKTVDTCFLEVRRSNSPAQALYCSCGFALVGERKNYYHAPKEDALLYRWQRNNR